jgi:hypothetical protein
METITSRTNGIIKNEVEMKKLLFSLVVIALAGSSAFAATIHVPADYSTIQAGIVAANDGDVVLVADGYYLENINFLGKAITVASHYWLDGCKKHIRATVIDGSQPSNLDEGSVVSFVTGEDTTSVLCGFTITGGTGSKRLIPGFPSLRFGGGIFMFASGAKIMHNKIEMNVVAGDMICIGGGIGNGPQAFQASVVIIHNRITHNIADGILQGDGGGISNSLAGRIADNEIYYNRAYGQAGAASGGGLSQWNGMSPTTMETNIYRNDVSHNKAFSYGDVPICGIGGGMELYGDNIKVHDNKISHNIVRGLNDNYGCGVVLDFPGLGVEFNNNEVSGNMYRGDGNVLGGGVAIWDGSPILNNNRIYKNQATMGGGIYLVNEFIISRPWFVNNTIVENNATASGGGIYNFDGEFILHNSILWNNDAPDGPQVTDLISLADVRFCDIEGGWAGTGNIDKDPKFLDCDYLLKPGSPCVDGGNPDPAYNDPEDLLNPGFARYPARGLVTNDIGAYGGPESRIAPDFRKQTVAEDHLIATAKGSPTMTAFPNPFNIETKFEIITHETGRVQIEIFNLLGERVSVVTNKIYVAGAYQFAWNAADFATGVYFVRCRMNDVSTQKKIILLK